MSEFTAIESKTDYQIISAVISNSDRNTDLFVDIKRLISSFQIFEHIEKPYLTAEVLFADTSNLVHTPLKEPFNIRILIIIFQLSLECFTTYIRFQNSITLLVGKSAYH